MTWLSSSPIFGGQQLTGPAWKYINGTRMTVAERASTADNRSPVTRMWARFKYYKRLETIHGTPVPGRSMTVMRTAAGRNRAIKAL